MALSPLADAATGICRRSASLRSSSQAPPQRTPCPTMMVGRSAANSMSAAFTTPSGSAPQREWHHLAARRLEHLLAVGAHGEGEVSLVVAIELLEGAAVELAGRHVAG